MHTRISAVLFDLDGTLLDTAPDFAAVLNGMRQQREAPAIPYQAIRQTVSHGARALVELGFGLQPGDHGFDELLQELLSSYQTQMNRHSKLFPGIDTLLEAIETRGLPWGIVTNKPARYTDAILSALALDKRSGATICPDHVRHTKPHAEPILLACAQLGCAARDALYIGDHRRDIEAGNNAGTRTAAVRWGYISAEDPPENWGADHIADDIDAILSLIDQN